MSNLIPLTVASSLSAQAFERIVAAIITGEIAPGEFIKEARIARQLNISRGPLREAMGLLEGYKLAVRVPNQGVQVNSLTRDGLRELFDLREVLEGLSCRLAAEHMKDSELDELEEILARHDHGNGLPGAQGYYTQDEDFHLRVARGSRSHRLIALLSTDIYYQVRLVRHRTAMHPQRAKSAHEEHRAILAALRARIPDAAEAAMRRHIANARALSLAQIAPENDAKLQAALAR